MPLTLIRHTQPQVAEGVCYGRIDLAVASSFVHDARTVVTALAGVDRIISSPATRCRKLANVIGEARHVSVEVDDRLREMDFGEWEGQLWSALPRHQLDAWAADFMHAKPHAGESVHELQTRVHAALADHYDQRQASVIVTHAGVIKAAVANSSGAPNWNTSTEFGGIVSLLK